MARTGVATDADETMPLPRSFVFTGPGDRGFIFQGDFVLYRMPRGCYVIVTIRVI